MHSRNLFFSLAMSWMIMEGCGTLDVRNQESTGQPGGNKGESNDVSPSGMPASEKSQNIGKPANHSDTGINKLQSKHGKSSPESPTQTAPAMGNGSKPDLQKNDPSTNDRIKKTKDTLVVLKSIAHSLQAARDLEVTMDSSLESLTKFETSRSAFDQSLFCFSVANINLEIAILSLNRSLGRPDIEKLSQAADKLEDSGHVCQSELEKI